MNQKVNYQALINGYFRGPQKRTGDHRETKKARSKTSNSHCWHADPSPGGQACLAACQPGLLGDRPWVSGKRASCMKSLRCWVFWVLVYQPTRSDLGCIPGLGVGCANDRGEPEQIGLRLYHSHPHPLKPPEQPGSMPTAWAMDGAVTQPRYKETNPC